MYKAENKLQTYKADIIFFKIDLIIKSDMSVATTRQTAA